MSDIDQLEKSIRKLVIENCDEESDSELELKLDNKMANLEAQMAALNTLLSQMKIPDPIKNLPTFSGTRNTLNDFIQNVDEIITHTEQVMGKGQIPVTFLRAIRNKIIDDADNVLTMYGTTTDWTQIKANLKSHYADKRNETSLTRDLHMLHQGNHSIEQYYGSIMDIQSTIINNIRLSAAEQVVKDTKEVLYREMCLSSFLAGLKEPLGSMIRSRNPLTIAEAFNMCIVEQNMYYMKNKSYNNNPLPPKLYKSQMIPQNKFLPTFDPPTQLKPLNQNMYYNHKPFPFRPQSQIYPNTPPFRQHFGQQNSKPLPALPKRQPPIPNRNNRVEPMDTQSNINQYTQPTIFNNSNHPWRNNFYPSDPQKFQAKEIHNLEKQEYSVPDQEYTQFNSTYTPNLDEYVENHVQEEQVIDEQVFHQTASDLPSDF